MTRERVLLGIDVGTTLIKSVLFNLKGDQILAASASVPLEQPGPGWAEQDMARVWDSLCSTLREASGRSHALDAEIAAVSVSGQGGGMWLVDREGEPVRKGITWLDGRAGDLVTGWKEDGTLARIDRLTGYHCFPGVGPLTLFRWFKHHDPEALEKAHKNLWAKDWAKFRLTGEICTDESDPSNGHFLRGERVFSRELFDLAGIGEYWHLLPPVVPSWQVMGRVTRRAAEETGLPAGTPVASGAWDVSSTGLGAGCSQAGQALTILGTAGVHMAVSSSAPQEEDTPYSLCVHCVPDRWVVNSMAMTATANLDWFIREFCAADEREATEKGSDLFAVLNEKVASVPIGAGGVLYLPFLQGERAPFVKPEARAVFFGMANATTRAELLRAVYEGVAFSTRHNYEVIAQAVPVQDIVLAGGGAHSPVWSQIVADCMGKPVRVPAGSEFGALGAAMNAAVAVGIFADHQEASANVTIARRHVPDREAHEVYSRYYAEYRHLIETCWAAWDRMAALG